MRIKNKKKICYVQISILLVAIFAFSFLMADRAEAAQLCTPNERGCSATDNKYRTECDSSGTTLSTILCEDNRICSSGYCVAQQAQVESPPSSNSGPASSEANICTFTDVKCEGNTQLYCMGSYWAKTSCSPGTCEGGYCTGGDGSINKGGGSINLRPGQDYTDTNGNTLTYEGTDSSNLGNSIFRNKDGELVSLATAGLGLLGLKPKGGKSSYEYGLFGIGITNSFWLGNMIQGLGYGLTIGQGIRTLGSFLGLDQTLTDPLGYAAMAGVMAGKGVYALFGAGSEGNTGLIGKWLSAQHAALIGIGVGVLVFLLTYKKTSEEIISFECNPWQAPVGGSDCEKCNNDFQPCSEYRCKSLGQACGIVNAGTKQEKCVWLNPQDVTPPIITTWDEPLTKGYKYIPDPSVLPPNYGVKIVPKSNANGCVEAFTPLQFGILTDEPAKCKIDYNHTAKFDDMSFYFGETQLLLTNHTQNLSLPGPSAVNAQSPQLHNDGKYNLYVRCQDANGRANVAEFAFAFCVNKGPDTMPPQIQGTSINNNMPFRYNLTQIALDVYVNEPSTCMWSHEDKGYDSMENNMTCQQNIQDMNANLVYTCATTLTGLKDRQDNVFYFRCKDQPWYAGVNESQRNVNEQSYVFTLKGSQPLNIIKVEPNGTIRDSTNIVPVDITVQTANGYNNGASTCYYSTTGLDESYVQFFSTGRSSHSQRQDLPAGTYTYYIKCLDLGGNADTNSTTFTVLVDKTYPTIVRAYNENGVLKIITDEDSECRYSFRDCNFEFSAGVDMPYANSTLHTAEWNTDAKYYIKCADSYGNQPLPNQCNALIKAYDLIQQATNY